MPLDKILLHAFKALGGIFGLAFKSRPGTRNRSGSGSPMQQNPALVSVVLICIVTITFAAISIYYVNSTPSPVLPDDSYRDLYERSMKRNEEYVIKVEKLTTLNTKLKGLVDNSHKDALAMTTRLEESTRANERLNSRLKEVNKQYFAEVKNTAMLSTEVQALRIKLRGKSNTLPGEGYIDDYLDINATPNNESDLLIVDPKKKSTEDLKKLIDNIKNIG